MVALSWSLVLSVGTVAEVLRIDALKAFAVLLLASIPGFIIYWVR